MYTSCSGRKPRQRKRKASSRWTKIKEKKKKAYSLRDRRQSRDTWTFKDILPGQTDRRAQIWHQWIISETLCSFSSSKKCQMGGVTPQRIKCVWMVPCYCFNLLIIKSIWCAIWYKYQPDWKLHYWNDPSGFWGPSCMKVLVSCRWF